MKMHKLANFLLPEIILRLVLLLAIRYLAVIPGLSEPTIQPEEWYRYKRPAKEQLVDDRSFIISGCLIPVTAICVSFSITKDKRDLIYSLLGLSLAICLTACVTDLIKITVPKPRPNYFQCCFPDGKLGPVCTGDQRVIDEGRKSFPSGHTSFAFSTMAYLFLYLSAKLNVFNEQGRGKSWRLCACMAPIILAVMTGIYRTTKNRHHPEDVLAGGIIGCIISYLCYRQHFPSIFSSNPGQMYTFPDDIQPIPDD